LELQRELLKKRLDLLEKMKWRPRAYQEPAWEALNSGKKRVAAIWHRRAGKDTVFLHWTVKAAQERPGVYYHMLPSSVQARKVIWNGRTKEGKPFLDAWPKDQIKRRREDEMLIELNNGSIWQCVGSDNFDAIVGTNPVGVVLSEYSVSDPRAWEFLRPILAENGGWACFPYTPRGHNHGHTLYKMAQSNPEWFCQRLTVEDTSAIPLEAVEEERVSGMPEEMVQQEFYCSFDAPLVGSYWGDQLGACDQENRITSVPHYPENTVDTWWDLGHSDATAIWFVQNVGHEIHLIDYYEANGKPLEHYASLLTKKKDERKFNYGRHIWPHDGGAKTLGSGGKPLSSMFHSLGYNVSVSPRYDVGVTIQRVRQILPRCWFDHDRCAYGLDVLRSYRKEEDESRSTEDHTFYKAKPRHDWSSHGSDAFRTGAMAFSTPRSTSRRERYTPKPEGPKSHWAA